MSSEPSPQNPCYVDVVLPIPVERCFSYAVPPSLAARAAVGMRAVVPVMNRVDTGFVVATGVTPLLKQPTASRWLPRFGLSVRKQEMHSWQRFVDTSCWVTDVAKWFVESV